MSVQQPGSSGSTVTIGGSLPAGANTIGAVTQSGAWSVSLAAAIPTGANVIGAVTQSGSWTVTANAGTGFPAALGQTTMANSLAVVIASNQSAIPVSQSGTWNVTVNAAIAAGTNTIGNVVPTGAATTGASAGRLASSAASTNATSLKASAGTVYGVHVLNANAAVRYLHLYDKASAPTVGTDTPLATIPVPPSNGAIVRTFTTGLKFATGIAYAMTTDAAAGNNAVASGDLVSLLIDYV